MFCKRESPRFWGKEREAKMKAKLLLLLMLTLGFIAGYLAESVNVPKGAWIYKPGPAMTQQQLKDAEPWRAGR